MPEREVVSNTSPGSDRIYAVIRRIPSGRVATYGQVAALAGLPGHARQVGQALRDTPEGLELPWQRVINAKGEVSPRGFGLEAGLQRHLLEEEGVAFDSRDRIDLDRFGWDPDARPSLRKKSPPVRQIESLLRPLGTAERAEGAKIYLKSDLDFLGVT